jgi:Uma2 family endonuclease
VVQTSPGTEVDADLPLKRWTVDEYHRMIQAEILTLNDRVELLEGQIIEMAPQDPPHASVTSRFGNRLVMLFAERAWVRSQLPITISPNSEPEPDIAIVRLTDNDYADRHPGPDDVFLVIEVADSTLNMDRNRKAKIYAKANIPDYWIVDVKKQRVFVFRNPQGDTYQSQQVLDSTETLSTIAFPEITIELQKLFP